MLSLQENVFIYNQGLSSSNDGNWAHHQAVKLFWRVFFLGQRHRLWNSLVHHENYLRELSETLREKQVKSCHAAGLQTISISKIRGSEGRCQDFDSAFYPTHNRTEERWMSIATAQMLDVALPPVELIQVGNIYFVRDGHHRISVAKSFGQVAIEAEVIVLEV